MDDFQAFGIGFLTLMIGLVAGALLFNTCPECSEDVDYVMGWLDGYEAGQDVAINEYFVATCHNVNGTFYNTTEFVGCKFQR